MTEDTSQAHAIRNRRLRWTGLALGVFLIVAGNLGDWQFAPDSSYLVIYPFFRFSQSLLELLLVCGIFMWLLSFWENPRLALMVVCAALLFSTILLLYVFDVFATTAYRGTQTITIEDRTYRLLTFEREGRFNNANVYTVLRCNRTGIVCHQIFTSHVSRSQTEDMVYAQLDHGPAQGQLRVTRDAQVIYVDTPADASRPVQNEASATIITGTAGEIDFSPDGTTLAVSAGRHNLDDYLELGGVWLYEVPSLQLLDRLEAPSIERLHYTDAYLVGMNRDGYGYLWEASTHEQVRVRNLDFQPGVNGLSVAEDRVLVLMGSVWLLDLPFFNAVNAPSLDRVETAGGAVAISPDAQRVIVAERNGGLQSELVLHWLETDQVTRMSATGSISHVAFSPDGRLVGAGGQNLTLLGVESKDTRWNVGLDSNLQAVAFSPDGRLIAAALADGTVRLYVTDSGKLASTLEGHTALVHSIAWHPDGALLASASDDGTVMLWGVAPADDS